MNVLSKLRDPDIPVQSISTDLEIDPGLHVKVLRTVNSVAFGLANKVNSVSHAISLLGRSRLESLVLSVVTKDTIDRGLVPGWFDMKTFWLSASRRAALARGIAQRLHPETQAEAFTVGLLQDMAVPLMAAVKGEDYREIYQSWQKQDGVELANLENERFGICHPTLGAGLAESWGFPEELVDHVSGHHDKTAKEGNLAIQVASLIKDNPGPLDIQALATRANAELNLDQNLMIELISSTEKEASELFELLS